MFGLVRHKCIDLKYYFKVIRAICQLMIKEILLDSSLFCLPSNHAHSQSLTAVDPNNIGCEGYNCIDGSR